MYVPPFVCTDPGVRLLANLLDYFTEGLCVFSVAKNARLHPACNKRRTPPASHTSWLSLSSPTARKAAAAACLRSPRRASSFRSRVAAIMAPLLPPRRGPQASAQGKQIQQVPQASAQGRQIQRGPRSSAQGRRIQRGPRASAQGRQIQRLRFPLLIAVVALRL